MVCKVIDLDELEITVDHEVVSSFRGNEVLDYADIKILVTVCLEH